MTRQWLQAAVAVTCIVTAACASAARPDTPEVGDRTVVERVVDGDTIIAGGERVRLIGVDTPETVHPRREVECFGREASDFTEQLLPVGTVVRLVRDVEERDRFGRLLAYVYRLSDDLFVNAELVRQGYALPYTVPPNVRHAEEFVALGREAREQGRGLWSACEEAG